jgi:hypothetical protein
MANAQGGQGRPQGQGGHGQTFTSRQHDKALYRRSEGPGVKREPDDEDVEEAGAAMEPQVDQSSGQGIVGGS